MTSIIRTVLAASAFTFGFAVLPAAVNAMPAAAAGSAVRTVDTGAMPVTQIRHGQCGRRCLSGRKSARSKGYRGHRYRRYRGRDGVRARHRGRVAHRKRRHRTYSHYRKRCRVHCGRSRHRHSRYVHRYGGWWYSRPWWVVTVPSYGYGHYDRHVAYCLRKYRSYDPRTDTYIAYSGRVRRCVSPYR